MMLDTPADIVIINTPLSDEFGTELALDLSDGIVGILLLVKGEIYDQVCDKVEDSRGSDPGQARKPSGLLQRREAAHCHDGTPW